MQLTVKECVAEVPNLIQKTCSHPSFYGQVRALSALENAIRTRENIFVCVPRGVVKSRDVTKFFEEEFKGIEPLEWAYVFNFRDSRKPQHLSFKKGEASNFADLMKESILLLKGVIPRALTSEYAEGLRRKVMDECTKTNSLLINALEEKARQVGFTLQKGPTDFLFIPIKDNAMLTQEQYAALSEKERTEFTTKGGELYNELTASLKKASATTEQARVAIDHLEKDMVSGLVDEVFGEFSSPNEKVVEYINGVKADIIKNLPFFKGEIRSTPFPFPDGETAFQGDITEKYEVNVIHPSNGSDNVPIVLETSPTYSNLIGKIEKRAHFGMWTTSFNLIRGGSLHRANGGYLVVAAENLLQTPFAYNLIKRVLKEKVIRITDVSEELFSMGVTSLEPEPIPADVRVCLVGEPIWFHLLSAYDVEFSQLFRTQAYLDSSVALDSIGEFVNFLHSISPLHLEENATAKLVQIATQLSGDKKRLSSNSMKFAKLLEDASLLASEKVTSSEIEKVIEKQDFHDGFYRDKFKEFMERGQLLLQLTGEEVGSINGLVVVDMDYEFGYPVRITARTWYEGGKKSILSVEREADMSGKVFNKGLGRITGYLQSHYLRDESHSMVAQLAMEQSSAMIDGDSATLAETCAIVSSISELPIKQNFAVTGALDQTGLVQPVGGVSTKIKGFFEACMIKGVQNGSVIVPTANIDNIVLEDKILKAIDKGEFAVYTVNNIDECLELLMGLKAGERKGSHFTRGSIHWYVENRLRKTIRPKSKKK